MVLLALVMVLVMLPSFAYAAADSAVTLTREEFYEALCIEYGDVLTDASANDLKDAGVTSATAWAIGNKIVTANSGLESNQEDPADK